MIFEKERKKYIGRDEVNAQTFAYLSIPFYLWREVTKMNVRMRCSFGVLCLIQEDFVVVVD